ncbi:MAG: hypothetical protein ACI9FJ_000397 [Alteromonadaceae bacterium]|jgi:hypothetical protein
MNKLTVPLIGFLILSQLSACGSGEGGSSSSTNSGGNTTTNPPTPPSPVVVNIPTTTAMTPSGVPPQRSVSESEVVETAELRHIHRNTIISSSGFIDSPNGKVERLTSIGLYLEVDREEDNIYRIAPRSNGLAYFKVTNTKPNGAVRIHNFHGVPVGNYLTFDTTNVADGDNLESRCRLVNIRHNNLPQQVADTARLQINGLVLGTNYNDTQGYTEAVKVCPVSQSGYYLAMVVFEEPNQPIKYGFSYYQNIQDGDLLDINIQYEADTVAWTSNQPIDNEYQLAASKQQWFTKRSLYLSLPQSSDNRFIPQFPELAVDAYHFSSDVTDLTVGIKMFNRQFAPDLPQVNFVAINDIEFDEVRLNPLDLSWQNVGQSQPEVISGLIFNINFNQTYAFMSMDPEVISNQQFNFPLDDIEHLLDGGLIGLTGAAGTSDGDRSYISSAALFTGFLYLGNPEDPTLNNNSDLFITAQATELLQLIFELEIQLLEDEFKAGTTP